MARKARNGKYAEYGRRILIILQIQRKFIVVSKIRLKTKIPRSSLYDVLGTLRISKYIDWVGEPQDLISMIQITPTGRNYLNQVGHQSELIHF